jgi:hypothetical protein
VGEGDTVELRVTEDVIEEEMDSVPAVETE